MKSLALVFDKGEKFEQILRKESSSIKYNEARIALELIHESDEEPVDFCKAKNQFENKVIWMRSYQKSIFEFINKYGLEAQEDLKLIAFGKYDWTQIDALEILCRQAQQNLNQDEILLNINERINEFNEITTDNLIQLVSNIPNNRLVPQILKKILNKSLKTNILEIKLIYQIINRISIHYPPIAKKEIGILIQLISNLENDTINKIPIKATIIKNGNTIYKEIKYLDHEYDEIEINTIFNILELCIRLKINNVRLNEYLNFWKSISIDTQYQKQFSELNN